VELVYVHVLIWKRPQSVHVKYTVVVKVLHEGQKLEVWEMPNSAARARLVHLYGSIELDK
jgi:hypothetical protein